MQFKICIDWAMEFILFKIEWLPSKTYNRVKQWNKYLTQDILFYLLGLLN